MTQAVAPVTVMCILLFSLSINRLTGTVKWTSGFSTSYGRGCNGMLSPGQVRIRVTSWTANCPTRIVKSDLGAYLRFAAFMVVLGEMRLRRTNVRYSSRCSCCFCALFLEIRLHWQLVHFICWLMYIQSIDR
jgi:hypothetical protein